MAEDVTAEQQETVPEKPQKVVLSIDEKIARVKKDLKIDAIYEHMPRKEIKEGSYYAHEYGFGGGNVLFTRRVIWLLMKLSYYYIAKLIDMFRHKS
jgi:hypothetical protein